MFVLSCLVIGYLGLFSLNMVVVCKYMAYWASDYELPTIEILV